MLMCQMHPVYYGWQGFFFVVQAKCDNSMLIDFVYDKTETIFAISLDKL